MGKVKYVLIRIDKFLVRLNFVILDIKAYPKLPFILGRPFMKIVRMLMDICKGEVKVNIKDHGVCYKVIAIT